MENPATLRGARSPEAYLLFLDAFLLLGLRDLFELFFELFPAFFFALFFAIIIVFTFT